MCFCFGHVVSARVHMWHRTGVPLYNTGFCRIGSAKYARSPPGETSEPVWNFDVVYLFHLLFKLLEEFVTQFTTTTKPCAAMNDAHGS